MTSVEVLNPKQFLTDELARRCSKNPLYSLRSFAQALSLPSSALSMFLTGKRPISKKAALKIVDALGLEPSLRQAFLNGCGQIHNLDFQTDLGSSYQTLSMDKYEVISDWYHYGILCLIETKDFNPSLSWISGRLGISLAEAKAGVERLVRVGVLDVSGRKWKLLGQPIKVENDVSTAATRKHQKQILEKAIHSLENDPMKVRDMSSMTLAIDPDLVPYALKEIRNFRRRLTKSLESKKNQKEVYHLAVQLYPVSKRKE